MYSSLVVVYFPEAWVLVVNATLRQMVCRLEEDSLEVQGLTKNSDASFLATMAFAQEVSRLW